jgi:sodium-dependent phosphate transporter
MLSGIFGAAIFLFTKYAVLLRKSPAIKGLILVPFYFWLTASLIVMPVIYKSLLGEWRVKSEGV